MTYQSDLVRGSNRRIPQHQMQIALQQVQAWHTAIMQNTHTTYDTLI